jgi:hypothetical protein
MSGTVITIRTNGERVEQRWEKSGPPKWEVLRDAVGGYIERIKVRWGDRVRDAYVNENGMAENLPFNPSSHLCTGLFAGTQILGNIVIWVPDPKVKK